MSTPSDPPPVAAGGSVSMVQAALDLVELAGVPVFPLYGLLDGVCTCMNGRSCNVPGKHPTIKDWRRVASADEYVVRAWWARSPRANIAIPCGEKSGLVVLDVDGPEGETALATLAHKHGTLPDTVQVRTARGRHLYFKHAGDDVRSSASQLGPKLDVRGEGGYVVAAHSCHASGATYEWIGVPLGEREPAPLPEWLRALCTAPAKLPPATRAHAYLQAALDLELLKLQGVGQGRRNDALNTAAFNLGTLIHAGLAGEQALAKLASAGMALGLSESEAMRTANSGLSAGMRSPRDIPEPTQNGAGNHQEPVLAVSANDNARRLEWVDEHTIEQPLPPSRWTIKGLHIGPGRPSLLAGYGASAKTISVQQLALAKAAGRPIWEKFDCDPGVVLHVDYEQGRYASIKRYQRLARGHGIVLGKLSGSLRLAALPRVFLDSKGAADAYIVACEGVDLCIIDALRGAAPGGDENDSAFRTWIDLLNYVSDCTGTAFLLLHHAGKPKEGHADNRTLARGSSAIFDACGAVFNIVAKQNNELRHMSQVKQPAEAEGDPLAPFGLHIVNVAHDGEPNAGVRVTYQDWAAPDPAGRASEEYDRDVDLMLKAVRRNPEASTNEVVFKCGVKRQRAIQLLTALEEAGRIEGRRGPRGSKFYRLTNDK